MSGEKSVQFYEEVLVLSAKATDQEKKQVYQASSKVIKDFGGKVYQVETWGLRNVANPERKKQAQGWYFHMVFSALPTAIQELRRTLKINSLVLYFHHERLHKKDTPESHMEKFKDLLEKTASKEKERQERIQKKQAGFSRP